MLSDENRNGTQKTQVYMPSRGMNAQKSHLISDPDVDKAFKYHAQYPGVMQGSQEGKRAKLWGPRAHFGANVSMKIIKYLQDNCLTKNYHADLFLLLKKCARNVRS